jgi:outer membrane protein assembly factor BamE (lipoprotein component of BamABCDE complex)
MVHTAASALLSAALIASLASCVSWGVGSIHPGQTETEVLAQLGPPSHVYRDGDQHLLEYPRGRMAQATHMARIGADGKLISYEQVLTLQKFAEIKVGESDKEAVLRIVGRPDEKDYYERVQLEAWSYGYKESGAWDSLMAVYFDKSGIVRKLENGPDPLRDPGASRRHRH